MKEIQCKNLKEVFNYCLISKWVLLEFEKSSITKKQDKNSPTAIVSKFQIIDFDFVTIYEFLRRKTDAENFMNFSTENESHVESVIDDTINDDDSEDLCSVLKTIRIEDNKISITTPLFKRLRKKHVK